MVNLITIYYTEKLVKNKNHIPGSVIIICDFHNKIIISSKIMKDIYIVDLKRNLIYIGEMCINCYNFHIYDNKLQQILGKHWGKYKHRFFELGVPILYGVI